MNEQYILPKEFEEALEEVVNGNYIKEFERIYIYGQKLLEFWKKLRAEFKDQTVETIKNKYGDKVISVFIGGMKERDDGTIIIENNALCEFFEKIFGIRTNKQEVFLKYKLKQSLNERVDIIETDFINFIIYVHQRLTNILKRFDIIPTITLSDSEFKEYLLNYYSLLNLIKEYLESILNILPNYNRKSFIIWSLQMLTYEYLSAVYPKFKDKNVFNQFKNIYGYKEVFIPNIDNEKLREMLTIYNYEENSLGKEILNLIKYIWNCWKNIIYELFSKYILNLPNDPYLEYAKMIRELILSTKQNIFNVKIDKYYSYKLVLYISGYSTNVEIYIRWNSSYDLNKKLTTNLEKALNELQPFIFGSYNIFTSLSIPDNTNIYFYLEDLIK